MAILSFAHSGLEKFAKDGDVSGIDPRHAQRLNVLLAKLSFSGGNHLGLKQIAGFHSVKLKYQSETYAVNVSGCWRLTFQVSGCDICNLNYVQYH